MNKSKEFISKTLNRKKKKEIIWRESLACSFEWFVFLRGLKTDATSLTRRKITSRTQLMTALSFSTKEISVKKLI